jgi:hypothetical protein
MVDCVLVDIRPGIAALGTVAPNARRMINSDR